MTTIGFTGTRAGMTPEQMNTLAYLLLVRPPTEFHHGDCIGADGAAHDLVMKVFPLCKVHVHPPARREFRAFCIGHVNYPEKGYLERNRDIIAACTQLIACPKEMKPRPKGGTWWTIQKARAAGKPVTVIRPDGTHYQ